MSQEERVYTIPLGKVLLSPDNRRAKRAINMIKEFARHHMKVDDIRIDEEVDHQIWARGIRSPPRKIRVRMASTGRFVLVSPYSEVAESETPVPASETDKTAPTEGSDEKPTLEAPDAVQDAAESEVKEQQPAVQDAGELEAKEPQSAAQAGEPEAKEPAKDEKTGTPEKQAPDKEPSKS